MADQFNALLAGLPETLSRLNAYNGRVDAILEYLGNQISALELAMDILQDRVEALEREAGGPG
jgi:hypothetical protein